MTMTEDEEIEFGYLEISIEETRKEYIRLRDHFQLLMNESGGPAEGAQTLLTFAEEFGAEHVMQMLTETPASLGVGFSSATRLQDPNFREKLADILTEVTHANAELSQLTGWREDILFANDPTRERRYNFDGRDVLLDIDNQKVRYVDEPGAEDMLVIEAVEPSNEPTREFLRQLKREQERKRDRQR